MKIQIEVLGGGACSLEDFAERHDLEMHVSERSLRMGLPRYIARFRDVEIMDRGMLRSVFGGGDTPEAAIKDYAKEIVGHRLVIHAMSEIERREFLAPNEFTAVVPA